jgi:hypothetical protein
LDPREKSLAAIQVDPPDSEDPGLETQTTAGRGEAAKARVARLRALREQGWKLSELGALEGITKQAVSQLLKKPR